MTTSDDAPGTPSRRQVLILAPMHIELQPLVEALSLAHDPSARRPVYRGNAGGTRIVATNAGVGTAAAAAATEEMLDAEPFDGVVVCGIAGATKPGVAVGTVVVPAAARDHAGNEYRAHPLGDLPRSGTILTGDALVTDPEALSRLAAEGVIALDMETAAVARVCHARGCPWSAVRSISDRPHDGIFDDDIVALLNADGSIDRARAVRYLARRPSRVRVLTRLFRDFAVAARAAAAATADTCNRLGDVSET